jgi:hypothetical protein
VVATYFLASWAKLRYGGLEWLTSATLTWAILRRGTWLAEPLLAAPWVLVAAQIGIVAFELLSPLVFVLRERWRPAAVGFFYSFHLVSFATITISFMPHLAAMTSFLPLERVRPLVWAGRAGSRLRQRARRGAAGHAVPVAGDPPVHRPGERAGAGELE